MKTSLNTYSIILMLFIIFVGCKKSAETEGIQALCPIVITTDPMQHAVDIDHDKVISIQFNTEMDSNSINSSTLIIQDAASNSILTGTIATTDNPTIFHFIPDLPLLPYNQYKLTIKKNTVSVYKLAMISDYTSDFTIIPSLVLFPTSKESGIVVGAGNYAQGSNVAISAFHSTGYVFINWTETGTSHIVSNSPNFLYPLNGNRSLTANFIPVVLGKFSVNLSSNPVFGGTTIGAGAYDAGSPVLIKATANNNFNFANWTKNGNLVSLNPNFQIESITSNSLYVANFNANPLSQISLTVSPNPITGGTATGGGTYHQGASVTIKASPFTGYRFINWIDQFTENIISSSANYTFVLNTNKSLIANYSINKYTITTTAVNGTISKTPDQLDYNHGSNLQLTAVPKAGYSFTSWSGDTIATSNPIVIKMMSNKKITANFTAIPPATYTLSITSNNGTVSKSPNQPSYANNVNVQLTATPITGYLFSSWSGDTIATSNPLNIRMTKNKNITANFIITPIVTYTLKTIGVNGAITLNPSQTTYDSSASVELSATPNAGYTFSSWTGDTTSASNPLIISMNANKNITGNFAAIPPATYTLSITSNNGTVAKNPNLIAYAIDAAVQLTATPSTGYTFTSWGGDTSGTTNPLSVTMSTNKKITANFTAIPIVTYTLATTAKNGIVTKNPSQINYNSGSTVELTATAEDGYTFTSWSGDAIGSTNPLSVAMSSNKNITANFTVIPIITYTLTTTATNGTVAKSPNQINYNSGTTVQLTATATSDYRFGSWTGDATGSTNPLSVSMVSDKNIAANFIAVPRPVALGTIANFGAYGGSAGITNQGVLTVINNGAIGTTAASTLITGFHDGITSTPYTETLLNVGNVVDGIFTAPPAPGTTASFATATNALSDANTAYLSISPASKPGGTDPGAGELGGLSLAPGIYKSSIATYKITNQDLTLDAQGDPNAFWIFQMSAGLTVGTPAGARSVNLIGGAQAKNVFWYVGSAAVINYAGGGTMVGTIIATAGVTLSSPANSTKISPLTTLNGRAISLVASVTMVNTIINNQ